MLLSPNQWVWTCKKLDNCTRTEHALCCYDHQYCASLQILSRPCHQIQSGSNQPGKLQQAFERASTRTQPSRFRGLGGMDLRSVVSKLRFLVKVHTAMKEPPISCLGEGARDNEEHRMDKY
ncbi:hypothetical protein BDL97_08G030100 [Sphagnum fallax]|nr:hypothetical protein BDL97_08G030100 [Sphagnum fallax]